MGNWRTVELKGNVSNEEAIQMIDYLTVDRNKYESKASDDDIFFLQFGVGVFGLNRWVEEDGTIDKVGNVFERDCDIDDLEEELNTIASKFTSLEMVLNAGDDYESPVCAASFIVKNGIVERVDPLVSELEGMNRNQIMENFFKQLMD